MMFVTIKATKLPELSYKTASLTSGNCHVPQPLAACGFSLEIGDKAAEKACKKATIGVTTFLPLQTSL